MQKPGRGRLRAADRLRRASDFQRVFRNGVRVDGRLMSLVVVRGAATRARVGLAAGRRVGGAVERNRAKRLVRETFRTSLRSMTIDIVVLPKAGVCVVKQPEVAAEYARLLTRVRRRLETTGRESPAPAAD